MDGERERGANGSDRSSRQSDGTWGEGAGEAGELGDRAEELTLTGSQPVPRAAGPPVPGASRGGRWEPHIQSDRHRDSCRSRPSHVLRATPTINPLVSLHDPASTKSPTSLRQAQPSHQQAWRHPRIWTPPACTSQRLTSVLERTKTTQIQRIFKSCQANNHCQDDETRSHRTLLRPAPAPIPHQPLLWSCQP